MKNYLIGTKGHIQEVGNGCGSLNPIALREDGWTPDLLVEVCEIGLDEILVSWGLGTKQRRWIKPFEFSTLDDI